MTILIFIFLRAGRNFSQLSSLITFHTLIFGLFCQSGQNFGQHFLFLRISTMVFSIQQIFLGSKVSIEPTYTPQVKEQQKYGSLNNTKNYPQSIYLYFLFL